MSCDTVVGDRKAVVIICVYLTIGTKRKSVAASQKKRREKRKKALAPPNYQNTQLIVFDRLNTG